MSEAKPLRWSFLLTFSIVVLAIWAVVSVFAHSQRSRLVDELVLVVATGTEKEAKAALRQMVRMPEPPLETFALAAASPSRSIARQAQDSIGELLRNWQTQAKSPRDAARVAVRVERLASVLHAERDSFSELDHPWLARTTERILRLANSAPPEDPLELAIHCESLLETADARPTRELRDVVPVASASADEAPDTIFNSPSRLALQSIVPEYDSAEAEPAPAQPPRRFNGDRDTARKVATPIPVEESDPEVPLPTAPNSPDPWANIGSRSLLERWLADTGTPKLQIERELERRGFGHLRSDVVRLALSDDTTARVQLVHDLMAVPGVGAKAWMMLLAEEEDADVRLAAVTMMAMSKDSQLLEKAWRVAIHDRDPRIAGLAEKLRDRR